MADLSIVVEELDVMRGDRQVAAGITFRLQPGDALILRGDNGSGKTSVLRAIAGFSAPAHGQIRFLFDGEEADAADIRAHQIHWFGVDDALADRLTVAETVSFWSRFYGHAASDVLDRVGLADRATSPAGALSTGQRRRLALTRLLLAPRSLWLMDEPLTGLDEAGKSLVHRIIAHHRADGGIVLMASHDDGLPGAPVLRLLPAAVRA
ncbi:heme ABC exporter ATP-binding protein CcmA [Parvularcula sp. LCG005]|uniref:heme ABC exporter ATP-binding protein CcmA n=1 Tax=Parvularcula sp. LCG005 TaxID=3078805 RepID=UPI002942AF6E|nr:heme ABC exporter ATP-binding protein CcmA [Parvularcula sp. LCG005]WOI53407.1 heme ABC exporter ATP-binding protein CcmA [Parvularcula sp. LCG005]